MLCKNPRFAVRITHMPTGISAEVTSDYAKTMHEAKQKALRLLRSRVYAKTKMQPRDADYEYADDTSQKH